LGYLIKVKKRGLYNEKEGRTNSFPTFNPYSSVVPVDKFFAEEQSQPGAGLTVCSYTVCFNVDPKQRIDKFFIHPNAIVFD
jgi:hypothetical protein